jgi:hypothetical protein
MFPGVIQNCHGLSGAPKVKSKMLKLPSPKKLGVSLRRPCRGQMFSRRITTRQFAAEQSKYFRLYLCRGKVTLAMIYLW